MAAHTHLDDDDDFGGDFPGTHNNRRSVDKRGFGDLEDDEDDIFGSKKSKTKLEETAPGVATGMILSLRESLQNCKDELATCQSELEAAKSEIQMWHSSFQNESFIPAGTSPEPKSVIEYLQTLKSSEESLREQLEKAKKKEGAFIVTFAKREQEIAELKSAVRELKAQLKPPSMQRYSLRSSARHQPYQQLFEMDDPEDTSRDNVLWGDAMEEIFIDMLYQDALQGRLKGGKITFREHGVYAQRLTAVGKKVFDGNQVRGKLTRLKGMQRLFTDLLSQTGMGWDPDTKTVVASDECWENAIRVKSKWGRFRTFGCPKYEELCTIFGASVAYGTMQHASTQLPADSDDERRLDEEMRARRPPALGHRQDLPIGNDDFIDLMGIGSPSEDAVTGSSRRPKSRKKSDFEVQLSEAVEEVKLTQRARRKRYEDAEAVASSKRSKETVPSDGTNAGYDPISHCATLLSELSPPLEPSQLVRAIERLLNPEMRLFFLSLDASRRDDWARNC